jgi:hypothetical protein
MQLKSTIVPTFLVISQISAECTNWTSIRWNSDTNYAFSTQGFTILETFYCDGNLTEPCYITPKPYQVTAPRKLNISVSSVDEDNIFKLARGGYYGQENSSISSRDFLTLNTTLAPLDRDDRFLKVEPGLNKSLGWLVYQQSSYGILRGCSNASLEGVGVKAMSPYMVNATKITRNEQTLVNGSVLAGDWYASSNNVTREREEAANKTKAGKSAGERTGINLWSSVLLGVAVACGVGLL